MDETYTGYVSGFLFFYNFLYSYKEKMQSFGYKYMHRRRG